MNTKLVTNILASAVFLTGCNKSPNITSDSSQVQAQPFHGQVYRSFDGGTTLTLISNDECELNEGGTTLLCKYTKQSDALRIVATAMGTNQVIYYRFTPQGVQDNRGSVLFSPERFAAAKEQQRLAEQRQMEEKQKIERQRLQAEEAKRQEANRIANLIEDSKRSTTTLREFQVQSPGRSNCPQKMVLTDAGLEIYCDCFDPKLRHFPFVYYWSHFTTDRNYYAISQHNPKSGGYDEVAFGFASDADYKEFDKDYFSAINNWAQSHAEAARRFEHK